MPERSKIHLLGICGTFMAGIAQIAKQLGYQVSGSDQGIYPPMSDLISNMGLVAQTFSEVDVNQLTDCEYIVGNSISRGNQLLEQIMVEQKDYVSAPAWLYDKVLRNRKVIAVTGTHGKSTVSSMLVSIFLHANRDPGFLIGAQFTPQAIDENAAPAQPLSAALGSDPYFIIEADEYDSAFFDKRPKFMHYRPQLLLINNLEFDHADIYANMAEIEKQFGYLLRTISQDTPIIFDAQSDAIGRVLDSCKFIQSKQLQACASSGSEQHAYANWRIEHSKQLLLLRGEDKFLQMSDLPDYYQTDIGLHNALLASAAASACGISAEQIKSGLKSFNRPARRLQLMHTSKSRSIKVWDDFAHHPTAYRLTINALKQMQPERQVIAVLEPRSNSMRKGVFAQELAQSLADADLLFVYAPDDLGWDIDTALAPLADRCVIYNRLDALIEAIAQTVSDRSNILCMSNRNFGVIPKLVEKLGH